MFEVFRRSGFSAALVGAVSLSACGGVGGDAKPKVELSEQETGFAAVSQDTFTAIAGGTFESSHPYGNYERRTWRVEGSADAVQLKLVFERFELENGYDFVVVGASGADATRHTGTKNGHEVIIDGNVASIQLTTDYSVTKWGFRIRAYEKKACVCPEVLQPVCGEDGATYDNACFAGCAGVTVDHTGECGANANLIPVNRGLESAHPYANDFDYTWTLTEAGATKIRAHFTRIDLEQGYDYLYITDASGRTLARYTGTQTNVTTPVASGDTLKIRLVTDYSVSRWGFAMDRYEVAGGCSSDSDCGSGERCNTNVQCLRAPCFSLCEPITTGGVYRSVSVSQLDRDPRRFDGRRVRVTAKPTVLARCTRVACSRANPCCNTCSGNYQLDGNIVLRGADGSPYTCSGNECNYESQCQPFPGGSNSGEYTFEGIFRLGGTGSKTLEVDRFRATSCRADGCNGEVCSNFSVNTACVMRPEYACYRSATCEAQGTGLCGWTDTPQLRMCLDAAGSGSTRPTVVSATDTPLAIPDYSATGVTSSIRVRRSGTVSSVKVSLSITHTYRGDLRVTLIAPDGTEARVHDQEGGSVDDLELTSVEVGALAGVDATGTWRLRVQDGYRQDVGTLDAWSLRLE